MRDAIQQEEQNTMLLAESDGCAVWQLRNETGEGTVKIGRASCRERV